MTGVKGTTGFSPGSVVSSPLTITAVSTSVPPMRPRCAPTCYGPLGTQRPWTANATSPSTTRAASLWHEGGDNLSMGGGFTANPGGVPCLPDTATEVASVMSVVDVSD